MTEPTLSPEAHLPTAPGAAALARSLRGWLASGRCQSPAGAYYAWISESSGEPSFEYPEITGYALTWLGGRPDPEEREVQAGERAAEWLAARFEQDDLSARAGWDGEAVYNFDLGMIATGLMVFGARFGRERSLALGLSLAERLRDQVQPDGTLPSIAAGSTSRSAWSTAGGAHVIKVVQALLLGHEHGGSGFRDAADRLVGTAARIQQGDGRFVTHRADAETMLHPHLYAAEGLWMYAGATGEADALDRARRATEWAFGHQLDNGALPRFVATGPASAEGAPEQLDLTAQAIRMALLLGLEPEGRAAALRRLAETAQAAGEHRALIYQPGAPEPHHNAWVTMFRPQAAELAAQPPPALSWRHLV